MTRTRSAVELFTGEFDSQVEGSRTTREGYSVRDADVFRDSFLNLIYIRTNS